MAITPANKRVIKLTENKKKEIPNKTCLKRINIKTPAVTKVEECTKEETGVGAAIAAGNQEEKGTWALLVINAIIKNKLKTKALLNPLISQSKKKNI